MSSKTKRWHVADPVHQMLDFGASVDCVRAVVKTAQFQRLRRISQLGLASYVFPGAVHTRLAHSMGAAHLAARVAQVIEEVTEEHRDALVLAALLHDVGHGPFSHSFERALSRILPRDAVPSHEAWTLKIISGPLAPAIQAAGVDTTKVCAIISGDCGGNAKIPMFLHQVVSSQLDVDRIDYLCRDAHFAGVTVGTIDVHYLVQCLRVISHGSHQTLGILAKGLPAYETFAFARHIMNRTLYYHKQVATFECMMEEALSRLVKDTEQSQLPRFLVELNRLQASSEGQLTTATIISELLDSYLQLTEDQVWVTLAARASLGDHLGVLSRRLLERDPVPSRILAPEKQDVLEHVLKSEGFTESQYRIRSLRSKVYSQSSHEQVFVQDDRLPSPIHVSEASSLVDLLRDRTDVRAALVIFDVGAADKILAVASKAGCLFDQRNREQVFPRPLAKTSGEPSPPQSSLSEELPNKPEEAEQATQALESKENG